MTPNHELTPVDRQLLDRMQREVPLVERPWEALGDGLDLTGEEVLERVAALRAARVLRFVGAIFDAARLGYQGTLAALAVPKERVEEAAEIVSAHPGVSHNYERDHEYRLWFTLTTPAGLDPEAHVRQLCRATGARGFLFLPSLRVFHIGVHFAMGDASGESDAPPRRAAPQPRSSEAPLDLDDTGRSAVRALQRDLPMEPEPFAPLAAAEGIDAPTLFDRARRFLREGAMRRYAALLRHQRAGYRRNVMTVWRVAPERIEEVGRRMARVPEVSHCYERATSPEWPWPLYAMVHGRDDDEIERAIAALREAADGAEPMRLPTLREFKKERVRYFTGEIEAWATRNVD